MSIPFKVLCLLYVCLGSVGSTTAASDSITIQPSATVSNSVEITASINATATSGVLNTGEAVSPSSVYSAQSSIVEGNGNNNNNNNNGNNNNNRNNNNNVLSGDDAEQELVADVVPMIAELSSKITTEIDPTKSKPKDVSVIDTLSEMMKEGSAILMKYNDTGNTTVNYVNVTDDSGFVLVMRRYDCVEERKANIPSISDVSTNKNLKRFASHVTTPFDCPMVVKNATNPNSRRKRRDVQIEVTMEIDAEEDEGDFHAFQMLHHHSRIRRNVQQCEPQMSCGVQRFETTLVIKNRTFSPDLDDPSTAQYKELQKEIKETLEAKLDDVRKVEIVDFDANVSPAGVKATLYLDVPGPGLVNSNITNALNSATVNDTLGPFEVDTAKFAAIHRIVVDGNYTKWTDWSSCDANFDVQRTRTCEGAQYGGVCHGPDKEIKKCDCTFNMTEGGNITSPLWPNNYPNGVKCIWVLEAPVNHTVELDLEEFHLEKDKKCFYDYMEFFDGDTEDHDQIGNRFCGRNHPATVKSTGQKLLVVFHSDKSENHKGFRAVWETKKIKEKVIEYVEQHVTALVMMYSPTVNDTHYPLGTATTCSDESQAIDKECVFDDQVFIISQLISAHIDRKLSLDGNNRIVITFEHIMNKNLFPAIYNGEKTCVSWNDKAQKTPVEDSDQLQTTGAWTKRGCSVLTTNITHTSCACDHQGLFAVVGKEKVEPHKLQLLANTYIGFGISFFILILAIVHIVWKIEIHGGEVMRINMCAAIIVMQCVFLIGAHVKAQQTLCGFLAFAVYFSVLAEFCWLLLHGLRIHGKIKKIFASNLNIEIVYVVIGWGLPLLLALIAIGVQIDLKNPNDVCWEAAAGSAMWGYAGPVIIIALFNVAVLLKLLIPTEDVKNGYDYVEMRYRVIKDFAFLACFALTCTMAYQAVEHERFTEQYFLTAFILMQAIAMFVFGREGRKDFVKRPEEPQPDENTAENQAVEEETPAENIYETVDDVKPAADTDLGEGEGKRTRRKKKTMKRDHPEKITVPTLKNLNIYKEGGQYVIEA